MDLALTPDQEAFRRSISELATTSVKPRAADIDPTDRFREDLFSTAADLCLVDVTIPRTLGGIGRD